LRGAVPDDDGDRARIAVMRPRLLAFFLAASSGCRTSPVEPVATPATPERPQVQADEQTSAPELAGSACRVHVEASGFGIDCATWRASLDEMASRREPGSQAYVEVMAWREHLVAFEADAIPAGAQLDHVYLELYTHLDNLVIRSEKVPEQLRVPDVGLVGLQVEPDVDFQVALDVIHTAAVATIGQLEILDEAGQVSASLSLSPRTGPFTVGELRVLGGGPPSTTDTAQTWPALVEQLVQQSAPGVEVRLFSNLGRSTPRLPRTPPSRETNGTYRDPEAVRRRMTDAADVRLTELSAEGGDDRNGVAEYFRNRLEVVEIDYYTCGLRDDPKLAGELALDVAVGSRGQVFIIQIANHSESLSREFIDCLTRRMLSFHIYRRGESVVVVHVSMRLQPKKP
jgi:hypothetical protein